MSMRHHWAELDVLLAELDEAARFKRTRPRLAAVAVRSETQEDTASEIEAVPRADALPNLRIGSKN